MKIRKASLQDLESLSKLFDGYRMFYQQQTDMAGAKLFIEERLIRNDSTIFCAVHHEQLAGFTQLYPSFTSVGMRRMWILNDLFVDAAFRRLGAAQSLLSEACQFARADGAARLILETGLDNHAAQKLYLQEGWEKDDQTLHFNFELRSP